MNTEKMLEALEKIAALAGEYSGSKPMVIERIALDALATPAAVPDARDCGCAHYWNCPSLRQQGEKPTLRLAAAPAAPEVRHARPAD